MALKHNPFDNSYKGLLVPRKKVFIASTPENLSANSTSKAALNSIALNDQQNANVELRAIPGKHEERQICTKETIMKKEQKNGLQSVGDKFKGAKISKTLRIDSDVCVWLRQESEKTGIPYEIILNAKLREQMNLPDRVESLVQIKFDQLMMKKTT